MPPMPTPEKRALLMEQRRKELRKLIQVYCEERGWKAGLLNLQGEGRGEDGLDSGRSGKGATLGPAP